MSREGYFKYWEGFSYRDEFTETLEKLPETRKSFEKKLTEELCSFIKEHYPNKKPDRITDELKSEAKSCARSALQSFEIAIEAQINNYGHHNTPKLPIVTSREKINEK